MTNTTNTPQDPSTSEIRQDILPPPPASSTTSSPEAPQKSSHSFLAPAAAAIAGALVAGLIGFGIGSAHEGHKRPHRPEMSQQFGAGPRGESRGDSGGESRGQRGGPVSDRQRPSTGRDSQGPDSQNQGQADTYRQGPSAAPTPQ